MGPTPKVGCPKIGRPFLAQDEALISVGPERKSHGKSLISIPFLWGVSENKVFHSIIFFHH